MSKKECIAMLLAGGQGSRLALSRPRSPSPRSPSAESTASSTSRCSNCANSGIDTVGVLTQYRPYRLHAYLGSGAAWDLDDLGGGVSILPPYATQDGGAWYRRHRRRGDAEPRLHQVA